MFVEQVNERAPGGSPRWPCQAHICWMHEAFCLPWLLLAPAQPHQGPPALLQAVTLGAGEPQRPGLCSSLGDVPAHGLALITPCKSTLEACQEGVPPQDS